MNTGVLLVEVAEEVAVVTMNRPESRNALSAELLGALQSAMADLAARADVAVVILTGADPAFCAGLDLKELGLNSRLLEGGGASEPASSAPWPSLGKPLIGAVNGVAVTGGLELALNCDFLIASERAKFADTHARVGVMPGWGLTVLLPQRVGAAMARRMSFTGDFVDAATALRAGLVTEVVAHDELLPSARRLALTIAANNRSGVLGIYDTYRRLDAEATAAALAIELEASVRWRREGRTDGLAERVPGVISRGRDQIGPA
ncbi:MAG: enoyl-CoA hydratase [Acidobacteriota bacterium]|nr:enoyl-CoA hydratase [Acidobacteriota bacterium]